MSAGLGLRTLAQLGTFVVVARILDVKQYGAYVAILALAASLGGLSGLGSSVIMLRETARDRAAFANAWRRMLSAITATFCLLFPIYIILVQVIFTQGMSLVAILGIGLAEIFFMPLMLAVTHVYQGHDRIGRASRIVFASVFPRFCYALLLIPLSHIIPSNKLLPLWATLYLSSSITSVTYSFRLVYIDYGVSFVPLFRGFLVTLQQGWPFAYGGMAQKIFSDIDKTILARLTNLDTTGAYSAAHRIADVAALPIQAMLSAATSQFFRSGTLGIKQAADYAQKILPFLISYGLLIIFPLYLLADLIPAILGNNFLVASDILRYLSGLPLLVSIRRLFQMVLACRNHSKSIVLTISCGAILMVGLNLTLIPYWGWKGSIISIYATEISISLIFISIIFWRKTKRAH